MGFVANVGVSVAVTLLAIGIPWFAFNYKDGVPLSSPDETTSPMQSVQVAGSSPQNPVPQPYTLLDPTTDVPDHLDIDLSTSQSVYLDKTELPVYDSRTKSSASVYQNDYEQVDEQITLDGQVTNTVILQTGLRSSQDSVPNINPTSASVQQQTSIAATKSARTPSDDEKIDPNVPTMQQAGDKMEVSSSALPKNDPGDGEECWTDYKTGTEVCKPICNGKTFGLPSMTACHPLLTCTDINSVRVLDLIGEGLVKKVYRAEWNGYTVAYSILQVEEFKEDFDHGLKMLQLYSNSNGFNQLIGFCSETNVIVTELHPLKDLTNLSEIFKLPQYVDNVQARFRLCMDYVEILNKLHSESRVMCDSNDLQKTLQQFLVTNDLRLVLNDMDALPQVNGNKKIKCGHRQLSGDFVAPEQLWPFSDSPFDNSKMPGYDEKVDIWKIPDVCQDLLGEDDIVKLHLFDIHKRCKKPQPEWRPSAKTVLEEYQKVYLEMYSST